MSHRALTMLLSDLQLLARSPARVRIKGFLLHLGEPDIERTGVLNRRAMWVHEFPDEWPDGLRVIEMDDGLLVTANLGPQPTNWRGRLA